MTPSEKQAKAKAEGRICGTDDCENGQYQRGLCGYHYRLMRAKERAAEGKVCRVDGCERGWFARQLCRGHYTTEYSREQRGKERGDDVAQHQQPVAGLEAS